MSPVSRILNVMIVDDEQEACDNLEYMLREYADVKLNVLGKYNTTKQAEQYIKQLQQFSLLSLGTTVFSPTPHGQYTP